MGADSLAENTPKCPRIYLPNLSAEAQKFWISMKNASLGIRSPCNRQCEMNKQPNGKK